MTCPVGPRSMMMCPSDTSRIWTSTISKITPRISKIKTNQLKIQIPERRHWDWSTELEIHQIGSQTKIEANPTCHFSSIWEIENRWPFQSRVSLLIFFSANKYLKGDLGIVWILSGQKHLWKLFLLGMLWMRRWREDVKEDSENKRKRKGSSLHRPCRSPRQRAGGGRLQGQSRRQAPTLSRDRKGVPQFLYP